MSGAGGRRRWWLTPSCVIGAALTGLVVAMALISYLWTPWPPTRMAILNRLQGPSAAHWFGTDPFGRDVFSMIMVGARNSLAVGLGAVGVGMVAGTALGLAASVRRDGLLDHAIMRTADFTHAFPAVLTAIMMTAIAGPGMLNAVVAIAVLNLPYFARLARGAALQVRAQDFIQAARAAGLDDRQITLRHVLPNIAGILAVQATIQFALAVLAEAGLSYLGLGTQPPNPSWGRMLNEAQTFMAAQPWLAIFPGAAIALTVLGFNLLGDGLRDAVDPRLRRSR
ncbi:ABC transporter permease [Bosea sp. (in: a-proteobacteria)]|uniref:ABC transporter permease n=1 Tax=Bosea sp. (in: a-proteobacteria) TaxID=1871050 RepID=UPI002638959E|nr:ABC transporter permease [Bosea sp. (in: a-proteobacteria)]MCO5090690.1 ABC transporter permease [Bosea sp. (in: a-proteobacteria)]